MYLRTRTKYDTSLAWFYSIGKDELIPEHISKQIPDSTISTWRNLNYESYFGYELRSIQTEALDYYELFHEHENLKKTIRVISKVWVSVSKIVLPVLKKKKEYEEVVIDCIQQLCTVFPKSVSLKIARISSSSFSERLSRAKMKCGTSDFDLCRKRHPQQLLESEIEKIKSLFNDPKLIF